MLYTAAMQSGPLLTQQAEWGRASSGGHTLRSGGAEEGQEALGGLLLLESPFSSRSQHPSTQGHGVRGRSF